MNQLFKSSLVFGFAIFLISSTSTGHTQNLSQNTAPNLSASAEISLMTCGPGEAVYAFFGHSALWVFDPATGIDRIYNYGTFDFNDPNFYYLFLRGTANYRLSVTNFRSFMSEYIREERFVKQQKLNLTADEKQQLFNALEDNYHPDNRYYRYDFLFLNCSSIIRDRVFETVGDGFVTQADTDEGQSFRELLQPYIGHGGLNLGINLLLSHKADQTANNWESMFLPDHMYIQFAAATNATGQSLAPAEDSRILNLSKNDLQQENTFNVVSLLLGLLFLFMLYLSRKKYVAARWNKPIDFFLLFMVSLIGILIAFMWLFSKHEVINANINLLWAFPFHLVLALTLWFKRLRSFNRWYAKITFFACLLFFILVLLRIQVVPFGILFFAAIITLRLLRMAFLLQKSH